MSVLVILVPVHRSNSTDDVRAKIVDWTGCWVHVTTPRSSPGLSGRGYGSHDDLAFGVEEDVGQDAGMKVSVSWSL